MIAIVVIPVSMVALSAPGRVRNDSGREGILIMEKFKFHAFVLRTGSTSCTDMADLYMRTSMINSCDRKSILKYLKALLLLGIKSVICLRSPLSKLQ